MRHGHKMASPQQIRFSELDAYLDKNKESARAFGRRAGIDKMTLNRLLNGRIKRFEADLVQRIQGATAAGVDGEAGAVGPAQFAAFLARISTPGEAAA